MRIAAEYAHEHQPDALAEISADERFAAYARNDYDDRADDLLAATLHAVEENVDPNSPWNGEPVSVDIANQYESARAHADRDRANDRYNPTRGNRPGVVFL